MPTLPARTARVNVYVPGVTVPTVRDVEAAGEALAGRVVRTPLVPAPALGGDVWVKAELLQRAGVFKVRGALHRIDALGPQEREAGVTTVSAGNHALAVALAAREAGVHAKVFMLATADPFKVDAARALGAEVDTASAAPTEGFARMRDHAARSGATIVHPYDDAAVIAGAGTVGLEIAEDLPNAGTVVVPVGGGGLISGIALAVKQRIPGVRVVGVEPRNAQTLTAALAAGRPVNVELPGTAADSLAPAAVGANNFAICRELVDEVLTLSEDDLLRGLRAAYSDLKLAAEVGGAAAVAALVSGAVVPHGPTVLVVSGGNIAAGQLRRLL